MTASVRTSWLVIVAAVLFACGRTGARWSSGASELRTLLPEPSSLAGWRVAEGPDEYVPETLFEVLDGGAERYRACGFRRLLRVRYERVAEGSAAVTVDIFDMGGDLGAFGIYSSARPEEADDRTWGTEGYRSGPVAAAWKGRVFVHGEADDHEEEQLAFLERLVAHVCATLPGAGSLPAILAALPPEGLAARSRRWVPRDLLGHAELPGGVIARYAIDGRQGDVFFSDLGSTASAADALAVLRAHYSRHGDVLPDEPPLRGGGFRFAAPGLGAGTVTSAGGFVAGVYGDLPVGTREALLARLAANLASGRR